MRKLYYSFLNSLSGGAGPVRMVSLAWSPENQYRQHFHSVYGDPTPEKVFEKLSKSVDLPDWLTVDVLKAIWPESHCDDWWDPTTYEASIDASGAVKPKTGKVEDGRLIQFA